MERDKLEREKFTFFRSYLESAKALDTKEDQADFLLAVCEYGLNGILPEKKKGSVAAVFAAVKPNIDTSLARAKAGYAGGSANKNEAKESEETNLKQTEANLKQTEANLKQTEAKESNHEAIRNKEVEIEVEVEEEVNTNNAKALYVPQEGDEPVAGKKYLPILEAWNQLPLTNIRYIRGKRLAHLQARIKENSLDDIFTAIKNVSKSAFLLGQNPRGWMITFDWFVLPNNFTKVLEGNYNRPNNGTQQPTGKNDVRYGYNKAAEYLGLDGE